MLYNFEDLYRFLQKYDKDIISWLEEPWAGKDKQESLLRLLGGLGLINKLSKYHICKGNYNIKTISKITSYKELFYDEDNNSRKLKDIGDKSDYTAISRENYKEILVTSSKCREKEKNEGIGKYDIRDIHSLFISNYNGYKITYCICTKDKERFLKKAQNSHKGNKDIKEKILREDTIIIDWEDLKHAFHNFKYIYSNVEFDSLIKKDLSDNLLLKFHQYICVMKTMKMKENYIKNILWGHICRSGKSYIMAGTIIEDSKNKNNCNYIIITPAINETRKEYLRALNYSQFKDFSILPCDSSNIEETGIKTKKSNKNIIILSLDYLKNTVSSDNKASIKKITWIKNLKPEFIFLDEAHKGGVTDLTREIIEYYGKNSVIIYITATYLKPVNIYNIKHCILWDAEDIKLCKNIYNKKSISRLIEKHGIEIEKALEVFSLEHIEKEYSIYPELIQLTHNIKDIAREEATEVNSFNGYEEFGDSLEGRFCLKEDKFLDKSNQDKPSFQNEESVLDLFYKCFGKVVGKVGDNYIYDEKYKNNFISRRDNIRDYYGEKKELEVILIFLPVFTKRGKNHLQRISSAVIDLLKERDVIPDSYIISINENGKGINDINQAICEARDKRINKIIVLSGIKCSVGVSIKECNTVILLNTYKSFDTNFQMMYRSMTENNNKKLGFVIDPNIHRVCKMATEFSSSIKKTSHPLTSLFFTFKERLLNINPDHYDEGYGTDIQSELTEYIKSIYEIYSKDTFNVISKQIENLYIELDKKDEKEIGKILNKSCFSNNKVNNKLIKDDDSGIKKGLEVNKTVKSDSEPDSGSDSESKSDLKGIGVKFSEFIKHIIPLICILTINHGTIYLFEHMVAVINKDIYLETLYKNQLNTWNIQNDYKNINDIIIRYMNSNKNLKDIARVIKELIVKNKNNTKELSKIIDKYLIPEENEKKSNAEVSTPFKLRQEMLDKIPVEFWTSIKKVFEPCSGKGGFIIDIIDRFMIGLKEDIHDEKERYKTVVEQCLYFSDINSTNIFICKLLIDPYNEYKLNYNEGNTLELNIKEKWGINGFDAVIGNPPYNNNGGIKKGGKNLYTPFTMYAINNTKKNGYVLYIVPTGILKTTIYNKKTELFNEITKHTIRSLNINECASHFNVSSTFTYLLIHKDNNMSNIVYDIICEVKNKKYKIDKIDISSINFIPIIATNESISILNKCKKENLNMKRVDKTSDIEKFVSDKFLYIKRLDHINYKNPYLNVYIGDKTLKIKGPILYTKYSKNLEILLKSKIMAFFNIITRFDGVIYHNFINMFGVNDDITIESENDLYIMFNLTKEEIKLIESIV